MSPKTMRRVLEAVTEAEIALRDVRPSPHDHGLALGCLTVIRAYVESALEVADEVAAAE